MDSQELASLYALSRQLLSLDDYDEMLDAVMGCALSLLTAERGFLVLIEGADLNFKIVRNWKRSELETEQEELSRSILAEVLRKGSPLLIEDALDDARFWKKKSVRGLQIRSVLAAPLQVNGAMVGALYLESRSAKRLFGEEDLTLFEELLFLSSRALSACVKRLMLAQRNALLENDLLSQYRFPGIVTRDSGFLRLLKMVAQVAPSDLPVLLQGPSGTGKELLARALHLNSKRAARPFVVVNCGAISPSLLESELFGHSRGAFTGATQSKLGSVASADRGTVFLDEVGELPKALQPKLLRLLQFGEVQPVGESQAKIVDVRFLSATNRELSQEVKEGNFREDLFFRLNAATIKLPSLQERAGDILPLFRHFLKRAAEKEDRTLPELAVGLEDVLLRYSWPGNIRELENEARRLIALTPLGESLLVSRLSPRLLEEVSPPSEELLSLAEQEKRTIERHLQASEGNRSQAAKTLGVTREGLRQKMKRYELS